MRNKFTVKDWTDMVLDVKKEHYPELAKHSVRNHHADGLHSLCLYRTKLLTLKIYFIPNAINPNSGYLVHPHNHRYEFDTTVLHGQVEHIRFRKEDGCGDIEHRYDWQTKRISPVGRCNLNWSIKENRIPGEQYNVKTDEIHTLRVLSPSVLGLIQYDDTTESSSVYVPTGAEFRVSNSEPMSEVMYDFMLTKVSRLLLEPQKAPPSSPMYSGTFDQLRTFKREATE